MISRISGRLEEIADGAVQLDTGSGLWYEVLAPACDIEKLTRRLGQEVVLFTIHYFEGDPSHGQQTPRLIGFLNDTDRDFFRLFTTVKGIGIRKALRALVRPPAEVAGAIAGKDAKFLKSLPEIGQRTAERIITELHDKVEAFGTTASTGEQAGELSEAAQEAISVLVQLGERHADAAALVERVMNVSPDASEPQEIIQLVYRLKAGAK